MAVVINSYFIINPGHDDDSSIVNDESDSASRIIKENKRVPLYILIITLFTMSLYLLLKSTYLFKLMKLLCHTP